MKLLLLAIPALLVAGSCVAAPTGRDAPAPVRTAALHQAATYPFGRALIGVASWYGRQHAGRPTASGEIHSIHLRTAAHRSLPFGTLLKVTNLRNGRTSVVRVNDRGPYVAGRTIDLSEEAARDLAMQGDGLARVRMEILPHGAR
ncbi:MAG TPA: septal ring lytic transglycosylase RlpA family protein [Telmatospirillum sp.]|nr:septal ring lytic transglycosylase RlpA family protein [Telmatospirillum sp.]